MNLISYYRGYHFASEDLSNSCKNIIKVEEMVYFFKGI
jgi:hypothetical protein